MLKRWFVWGFTVLTLLLGGAELPCQPMPSCCETTPQGHRCPCPPPSLTLASPESSLQAVAEKRPSFLPSPLQPRQHDTYGFQRAWLYQDHHPHSVWDFHNRFIKLQC
ncbi:MAG: hypothetical protein AB7F28_01830 [Candidatus Margulisiibacteriota bacterium]